jgi:hypothetical protein
MGTSALGLGWCVSRSLDGRGGPCVWMLGMQLVSTSPWPCLRLPGGREPNRKKTGSQSVRVSAPLPAFAGLLMFESRRNHELFYYPNDAYSLQRSWKRKSDSLPKESFSALVPLPRPRALPALRAGVGGASLCLSVDPHACLGLKSTPDLPEWFIL